MESIEAVTVEIETLTLNQGNLEEFENQIRGDLITSQSEIYEEVRTVWNGLIDKRPALIVRCIGTGDVVDAVNFARETRKQCPYSGTRRRPQRGRECCLRRRIGYRLLEDEGHSRRSRGTNCTYATWCGLCLLYTSPSP